MSLSIHIISKCYIACVYLFFVTSTYAYPNGAPSSACTSMTPGHYPPTSQSLQSSPYTVTAELISDQSNTFTVTISSSTNTPFKGIFLQARVTASGSAEGSWQVPSGGLYKNLDCSGAAGALTHTSRDEKSTPAQFTWIAPTNTHNTNFIIYATVVRAYDTFYVKIPSSVVSVHISTTGPPAATASPISTSSEISNPFLAENRANNATGSGGSANCLTPIALLPLLTHFFIMTI